MRTLIDNKARILNLQEDKKECQKKIKEIRQHLIMIEFEEEQIRDHIRNQEAGLRRK